MLGPDGDTLVFVSDDEDPIEFSPPPTVARVAPKPTPKKLVSVSVSPPRGVPSVIAKRTRSKIVPFSREDYTVRRHTPTAKERQIRSFIKDVLGRDVSWNVVKNLSDIL